jgi:capsular exopolysaccharide synthesis family protein
MSSSHAAPDLNPGEPGGCVRRERVLISRDAEIEERFGLVGARYIPRREMLEWASSTCSDDTGSGGFAQYWQTFRRHRSTILSVALLGLLAGYLVSLVQTPVYEARTLLEIQSINENFLNMAEVNVVAAPSMLRDSDVQTHVQLLQSNSLIERVVAKLKLDQTTPERSGGLFNLWRVDSGPSSAEGRRERAVEGATQCLKVRAGPQNRIVEAFYYATDARQAADFLNTLTAESIQQDLEARWESGRHTREWLTRQMEDMKTKLEKSEDELQAYARVSGLLFTSEKDNVVEDRLKQLQEELSKAQADRVVKQSRYEILSHSPANMLPDVVDDGSLREYQVRLADMRRQLAELNSALTPLHPKVKRLEAQIASVEAELDKEYARIFARVKGEYESAQRREKLLSTYYVTQSQIVSNQAAKSVHYTILKREVESNRQLYEAMLKKVKEAGIAAAVRATNFRVVDVATPPSRPYRPNRRLNASLGLLAGMFVGMFVVLLRERSDTSVHSPGEASVCLHIPELGIIPVTRRAELAGWLHKSSLIGESFRSTVTSILLSGENGDRPRVIVLSSPNPSEGKTTIASNLAIALAETGQKILLIDADLRKPQIHRIFNVLNSWGLSDVLRERNAVHECPLEALVRETHIRDLYVLPSGPGTVSITNLFHSTRMRELLDRFRNEFDTVLIDTPAMLLLPDARVLAQLADGVVLVLRAGFTTRDSILAAKQRFTDDRARVLGSILNHWNPAAPGSAHASGYRYYHKYYKSNVDASS